ncbi:MAG: hypothetical protein Q8P05_01840 [Candidatus Diapherotrites archaeon]|nr:hypothetical protein [Candidatus Diapherotrites archaeon]MDZ4256211.1 hypothetical protein [archaeon]
MEPFTIGLILSILMLGVANWFISTLPKKRRHVNVAFIPPAAHYTEGGDIVSPNLSAKLDAHVQSTTIKFTQIHSRLNDLERAIARLAQYIQPPAESVRIMPPEPLSNPEFPIEERITVRTKKRKKKA